MTQAPRKAHCCSAVASVLRFAPGLAPIVILFFWLARETHDAVNGLSSEVRRRRARTRELQSHVRVLHLGPSSDANRQRGWPLLFKGGGASVAGDAGLT